MTKEQAIKAFWAGYGLKAYEENSVPSGASAPEFPYVTYELATSSFGPPVPLTASLWYRSTSWTPANEKAEEIARDINWYKVLKIDGGAIIIRRSYPFAQSMGDPSDDMIRRKVLSISAEFVTNF